MILSSLERDPSASRARPASCAQRLRFLAARARRPRASSTCLRSSSMSSRRFSCAAAWAAAASLAFRSASARAFAAAVAPRDLRHLRRPLPRLRGREDLAELRARLLDGEHLEEVEELVLVQRLAEEVDRELPDVLCPFRRPRDDEHLRPEQLVALERIEVVAPPLRPVAPRQVQPARLAEVLMRAPELVEDCPRLLRVGDGLGAAIPPDEVPGAVPPRQEREREVGEREIVHHVTRLQLLDLWNQPPPSTSSACLYPISVSARYLSTPP